MSAHKTVIIKCDGCGATTPPETLVINDLLHLLDPITSVADARQHAHRKGWAHTKLGKDLCPSCRPAEGAKPKVHHAPHSLWRLGRHS